MKTVNYTYKNIGIEYKLDSKTLDRYVKYMTYRWSEEEELQCKTGYAQEWALRFKNEHEWDASDNEGKRTLKMIDRGEIWV